MFIVIKFYYKFSKDNIKRFYDFQDSFVPEVYFQIEILINT